MHVFVDIPPMLLEIMFPTRLSLPDYDDKGHEMVRMCWSKRTFLEKKIAPANQYQKCQHTNHPLLHHVITPRTSNKSENLTLSTNTHIVTKLFHAPEVAILPIGDHFTMDPRQAAWAAEVLDVDTVIPAHFGTFPLLTGTVAALKSELSALECHAETVTLQPGQSVS